MRVYTKLALLLLSSLAISKASEPVQSMEEHEIPDLADPIVLDALNHNARCPYFQQLINSQEATELEHNPEVEKLAITLEQQTLPNELLANLEEQEGQSSSSSEYSTFWGINGDKIIENPTTLIKTSLMLLCSYMFLQYLRAPQVQQPDRSTAVTGAAPVSAVTTPAPASVTLEEIMAKKYTDFASEDALIAYFKQPEVIAILNDKRRRDNNGIYNPPAPIYKSKRESSMREYFGAEVEDFQELVDELMLKVTDHFEGVRSALQDTKANSYNAWRAEALTQDLAKLNKIESLIKQSHNLHDPLKLCDAIEAYFGIFTGTKDKDTVYFYPNPMQFIAKDIEDLKTLIGIVRSNVQPTRDKIARKAKEQAAMQNDFEALVNPAKAPEYKALGELLEKSMHTVNSDVNAKVKYFMCLVMQDPVLYILFTMSMQEANYAPGKKPEQVVIDSFGVTLNPARSVSSPNIITSKNDNAAKAVVANFKRKLEKLGTQQKLLEYIKQFELNDANYSTVLILLTKIHTAIGVGGEARETASVLLQQVKDLMQKNANNYSAAFCEKITTAIKMIEAELARKPGSTFGIFRRP